MSRIGNSPISIPEGVNVDLKDNVVTVKGKLGELTQEVDGVKIIIEDGTLKLERNSESKEHKAKHGLYRALINNMIEGVSKGFTKELELVGVIKETKKNTFKLVKNKHEKEETIN